MPHVFGDLPPSLMVLLIVGGVVVVAAVIYRVTSANDRSTRRVRRKWTQTEEDRYPVPRPRTGAR